MVRGFAQFNVLKGGMHVAFALYFASDWHANPHWKTKLAKRRPRPARESQPLEIKKGCDINRWQIVHVLGTFERVLVHAIVWNLPTDGDLPLN